MPLHPAVAPFSFTLLVLFGLYMVYEVWRWARGNLSGLTRGQFRRRLVCGFLLETALLLWFLAGPLLHGRRASAQLLYLMFTTLLVFLAMILAVREAAFVAREYSRVRGELARRMSRGEIPEE